MKSCKVCGVTESTTKRFCKGHCYRCYQRILLSKENRYQFCQSCGLEFSKKGSGYPNCHECRGKRKKVNWKDLNDIQKKELLILLVKFKRNFWNEVDALRVCSLYISVIDIIYEETPPLLSFDTHSQNDQLTFMLRTLKSIEKRR